MQPFELNSVDEKEFLEKSNPKPKLKILKIVLIISFIIVSLAIVGVILFFVFKKDNETHPMEKEEDKKEEEESEIETETKEEESEIENETEEEEIYEKEEEKEEEIKEEEEEQDIDHSIGKIICKYKISSINKPIQILSTDYLKRSDFNIYINNKKINYTYEYTFEKTGENEIEFLLNEDINMYLMFKNINSLTTVNIISEKGAKLLSIISAFENCTNLEEVIINGIDTKEITTLHKTFYNTKISSLEGINITSKKITDMSYSFAGSNIISLTSLNIETRNVKNMSYMFFNSKLLNEVNLKKINTSNVIDFS